MKTYEMNPRAEYIWVTDTEYPDSPYALANSSIGKRHSPTGFSWGYGGSGPFATAVTLLLDVFGEDADDVIEDNIYPLAHAFKFEVVAKHPMNDSWSITEDEIRKFITEYQLRASIP